MRYVEIICFFRYLSNVLFPLSLRFLFTDYNRLSSVGGETSMAEMIATLSDACEREFGFLATRLFRVFKTEDTQGGTPLLLLCVCVGVEDGMSVQCIPTKTWIEHQIHHAVTVMIRIFFPDTWYVNNFQNHLLYYR